MDIFQAVPQCKRLECLIVTCDEEFNKKQREVILASLSEAHSLTKVKLVAGNSFKLLVPNKSLKKKMKAIMERNKDLQEQFARTNAVKSAKAL